MMSVASSLGITAETPHTTTLSRYAEYISDLDTSPYHAEQAIIHFCKRLKSENAEDRRKAQVLLTSLVNNDNPIAEERVFRLSKRLMAKRAFLPHNFATLFNRVETCHPGNITPLAEALNDFALLHSDDPASQDLAVGALAYLGFRDDITPPQSTSILLLISNFTEEFWCNTRVSELVLKSIESPLDHVRSAAVQAYLHSANPDKFKLAHLFLLDEEHPETIGVIVQYCRNIQNQGSEIPAELLDKIHEIEIAEQL